MQPDYIFETSWEVCNRVGGIYAVLSTKAASMQAEHKDKVIFIGPELWKNNDGTFKENSLFKETKSLLQDWQKQAKAEGLNVRVGRWLIPGKPIAILVDFSNLWQKKNEIFAHVWDTSYVNSLEAYGDYDEASLFGYATGMVIESVYRFYQLENKKVVAHFHEWMTSFGLFYVREHTPKIATLFTTHATSIGRSIAGNNKPLYDYFEGYHGDQMAEELNMVSKHSTEKQAAHLADCFTTVSYITDRECKQLLDKPADILTPNGFETEFLPKTVNEYNKKRELARKLLIEKAQLVLRQRLEDNPLLLALSGRYEWKNKGIDAFIHSLAKLRQAPINRQVVAFIMIPAWQKGVWQQLGANDRFTTHQLYNSENDPILRTLNYLEMYNDEQSKVKVIFVPSYLNGDDGVFNLPYYDLLIGMDLTVFPSYYEPWGYTPMESIAFQVPTITTNLAGFGQWIEHLPQDNLFQTSIFPHGVTVVQRTDSNWEDMTMQIANAIIGYANLSHDEQQTVRSNAFATAKKANWDNFFKYYREAYELALSKK